MRKPFYQNALRNERGQAVIEYILMISLVVVLFGLIGAGFRGTIFNMWSTLTQEIAAGCPGCSAPAGRDYKLK